jgi:hypothetical protein
VAAAQDNNASWQTIYHGLSPRLYRVACSAGVLDVTADGQAIARLRPGQSIDVEAQAVRVTTTESTEAIGGYSPILLHFGAEE